MIIAKMAAETTPLLDKVKDAFLLLLWRASSRRQRQRSCSMTTSSENKRPWSVMPMRAFADRRLKERELRVLGCAVSCCLTCRCVLAVDGHTV